MKYCVYCGSQLREGLRFCTKCGKPVVQDTDFRPAPDPSGAGYHENHPSDNKGGNKDGAGPAGNKKNRLFIIILILIIVLLILGASLAALSYMKTNNLFFFASDTGEEDDEEEEIEISMNEEDAGDENLFSLTLSTVTLWSAGETQKLSTDDEGIAPSDISWTSSDDKIATVDEEGLVTAVSSGTAVITATYGTQTAECTVVCNITEPSASSESEDSEDGDVSSDDTHDDAIHSYGIITEDCTWEEAYEKCLEYGGYLANINTSEEFEYILEMIEDKGLDDYIFYLGACRDADDESYYWIDKDGGTYGEALNDNEDAWCADTWMEGEPSFVDGDTDETVLGLFYLDSEDRWVFNDEPVDILEVVSYYSGMIGFICEYE